MNRLSRKLSAAGVAGLLVSGVLGATLAPPASADDDATLTVVGTSDVSDSNLVAAVIEPDFQAKYPGVDLKYVPKGTGDAIAYAEAGTASAMIVHAASLENQFVDQGYSAEPAGRSIFWGDYVLLGPASDPAGVTTNGAPTDDIRAAFTKVAAAGAENKADFVSRGNTAGTVVQEHAIWAGTTVAGCTVSAAQGGGKAPATSGTDTTCPTANADRKYPSWYQSTNGVTQAPNVQRADVCNFPNASAGGANDCYVFTDRGTYAYLKSTGSISKLQIVARSKASSTAENANLLVNSFHAYAVSADKFAGNPNVKINSKAAKDFLDFITSPEEQQKIGAFLRGDDANNPDPPFIPSAAPRVTSSALPTSQAPGATLTINGAITNVTPGTPALSGKTVELYGKAPGASEATLLKTTTTNETGGFTFTSKPSVTRDYSVRVPQITQVENPELDPVFKDILTATSKDLGTVAVTGSVAKTSATRSGRVLTVKGTLSPTVTGSAAHLDLYVKKAGATEFTLLTTKPLKNGDKTFNKSFTFTSPGTYKYHLTYVNDGVVAPTSSPDYGVTIP